MVPEHHQVIVCKMTQTGVKLVHSSKSHPCQQPPPHLWPYVSICRPRSSALAALLSSAPCMRLTDIALARSSWSGGGGTVSDSSSPAQEKKGGESARQQQAGRQ
jgi:hypothetical protein